MSDDMFDDGLVHGHAWFSAPAADAVASGSYPVADVTNARTPSTVHHDDHYQQG